MKQEEILKRQEVLNKVISGIEQQNWDKVERNLTDNFRYQGGVPRPLSKNEWIKVQRVLHAGMPDLRFHLHDVAPENDYKLKAKIKVTGTHTSELPPFTKGVKPLRATGKKIEMPDEEMEVVFSGDKIWSLNLKPAPHGGINGILEQLDRTLTEKPAA